MITVYAIVGTEQSDDGNFFCEVPLKMGEKSFAANRFIERDQTQEGAIKKMYKRLKKKFGWWCKLELNIESLGYSE